MAGFTHDSGWNGEYS